MATATKNDSGDDKVRFDLIPPMPMFELARVYTIGAKKYGDRNYENGMSWGRVIAAMLRHTYKWLGGEKYDQTDGQHHLASVAWGALTLMEYEHTHPELDDRGRRVHDFFSTVPPEPAAPVAGPQTTGFDTHLAELEAETSRLEHFVAGKWEGWNH